MVKNTQTFFHMIIESRAKLGVIIICRGGEEEATRLRAICTAIHCHGGKEKQELIGELMRTIFNMIITILSLLLAILLQIIENTMIISKPIVMIVITMMIMAMTMKVVSCILWKLSVEAETSADKISRTALNIVSHSWSSWSWLWAFCFCGGSDTLHILWQAREWQWERWQSGKSEMSQSHIWLQTAAAHKYQQLQFLSHQLCWCFFLSSVGVDKVAVVWIQWCPQFPGSKPDEPSNPRFFDCRCGKKAILSFSLSSTCSSTKLINNNPRSSNLSLEKSTLSVEIRQKPISYFMTEGYFRFCRGRLGGSGRAGSKMLISLCIRPIGFPFFITGFWLRREEKIIHYRTRHVLGNRRNFFFFFLN